MCEVCCHTRPPARNYFRGCRQSWFPKLSLFSCCIQCTAMSIPNFWKRTEKHKGFYCFSFFWLILVVFSPKSSPICFVVVLAWFLHLPGSLIQLVWLLSPSPQGLASKVPLQAQKCSSHPAVLTSMWHQPGAENTFLGAAVDVWLPLSRAVAGRAGTGVSNHVEGSF